MDRIQELNHEMKKQISFDKKTIDMTTKFTASQT